VRTQVRLRGYFLPPRPNKSAVEGQLMADAFIEERRASLERYLQRLALHEAALKSEVCSRARCALMRTPLLTLSQVCACECVCVCV